MAGLTKVDRVRLRDLISTLGVLTEGAPPVLATLANDLPLFLDAEHACCYGLSTAGDRLHLDFVYTERDEGAEAFAADMGSWIAQAPVRFGFYNPVEPEPWQRNRALRVEDFRRPAEEDLPPLYTQFLPRWGLEKCDQMRVVLCEGSAMLAWVGGFREQPFGLRQRAILSAIVPALRRRLLLDRHLEMASFHSAALTAALEALAAPAYILDGANRVVQCNPAGKLLLERDRAGVAAELRQSRQLDDGTAPFAIAPFSVAGITNHCLAIRRMASDQAPAIALVGLRWGLTPRQVQVLELLARGFSNKAIGVQLRCAERTVELHVTAILEKSSCPSRSALMARLLKG